jgi:hypothetical protein
MRLPRGCGNHLVYHRQAFRSGPAMQRERSPCVRFVVAIVSFCVALALIGLGIAQRTIFAEPDRVTDQVTVDSQAPITIIDGAALNFRDGRQKIEIGGAFGNGSFAAYGRTADLIAWAGDTSYNHIVVDGETGELVSQLERGTTNEAIDPKDSDLWLGEYSSDSSLEFTVNVPDDVSVIVLSNGVDPAPPSVSVTWPVDNRAVWSGPLLIGGVLFLLLGLGFYLWALAHLRRSHGPRRKPPTQPKLPARPRYNYRKATKAVRQVKPKAIEKPRGRRSAARMSAVVPAIVITAVVLSGCSVDELPDFITGRAAPNPPAPTATAEPADDLMQAPAVTVPQVKKIVERVAKLAAEADGARDAELIKERFTGAALQLRESNYAMRKVDNSLPKPSEIPPGPVDLVLPQQTDAWPRTVFTVIQETETPAPTPSSTAAPEGEEGDEAAEEAESTVLPTALMLIQESPREPYKVAYSVVLEATAEFDVAAETVGAVRHDPENKLLKIAPVDLAAAYADVMLKGDKSELFALFDLESDALLPEVGAEAKAKRAKSLSTTKLTHSTAAGVGEPIAMATSSTGAIVAVSVTETENAKPKESGAILSPEDGTKALSKVTKTTKGISATYAYQLLFYVPPAASHDKIVLLGFGEGLVSSKEL